MNDKIFKKYTCQYNNEDYVIEEDFVGWYLVVYKYQNAVKSSEDYLFDTLEDAFFEAKERFGISKKDWKEVSRITK